MKRLDSCRKLTTPYPMLRVMHRILPPDYCGPVFVWDIDKTYLDTRFSQLKHLFRIPLEFGVDKKEVPGAAHLLQGLRKGPGGRDHRPLYFVSASPHQIRKSIEKKMLLDGVEFDGITFKDPVKVLMRGQFDQLKEQTAFKLSALLLLLKDLPAGAEMVLFGDDAEKDALIYSLFADIAAGRLESPQLDETLLSLGVRKEYAVALAQLASDLPCREATRLIYIHLTRCPDGSSISEFGPSIIGYPTTAAAARHLLEQGYLSEQSAADVAATCLRA